MLRILIWQIVLCIIGFLRLQSLRYKNKRENGNLIAKNWQFLREKDVFWLLKSVSLLFWGDFLYKKLQETVINSSIHILWTKKLRTRHPTAPKRSHWLQSIAITAPKVGVDCNQNLKLTPREGIFSNQWLNDIQRKSYTLFYMVTTQSSLCLINSPLVKSMDSSSYR